MAESARELLEELAHANPAPEEEWFEVARESAVAERLSCGHPSACEGMAGQDGHQPGCGWCADIADNGTLINHLSARLREGSAA